MRNRKIILAKTLSYTGVQSLYDFLRPEDVCILTIHRVLPLEDLHNAPWESNSISPTDLRAVLEYLSEYRIITLEEVIEFLRTGKGTRRGRKPFVAITFDDGYYDFHRYAFPILHEMGIPATLFVTTGPVERGKGLWWDEISMRIWYQPNPSASAIATLKRDDPLRHAVGKFAQSRELSDWEVVQRYIRKLTPRERDGIWKAIKENVPVNGPKKAIDMLTTESIREISNAGISVQAHTVSHPYLDEIDRDELVKELGECKEKVEFWTGHKVEILAYPAGRVPGQKGMEIIKAYFRAAVTTRPGTNRPGEDLYRLKRKDIRYLLPNGRFQEEAARMEMGGILDSLWARAE